MGNTCCLWAGGTNFPVVPCIVWVLWLWREMVFGFTLILRVQYMMAHMNRYFEGSDNGQMTPRGYPAFNSYVKNLRVFVFRTDGDINPVWASLTTFLQVHSLRVGWRNHFFAALERVSSSPRATSVLGNGHVMCCCVSFLITAGNSVWCYLRTYSTTM
jgi:hypothetical protein